MRARALLINGTVGAGKTSVAEAVGDLLAGQGVPSAVIDLDWLRRAHPSPPGDRFNVAIQVRNLGSLVRNYVEAGAERVVIAGVLEEDAVRRRFAAAIGVELQVCRLVVDLDLVRRRLARRHEDDEEGLRWHLDRSGELDAILAVGRLEDFAVEATGLSLTEAAAAVLKAWG